MLVHKACVRCERCSGQTDYVQGLGALAEHGARGVEHVCSSGGWVLGSPLWAIRMQEGVGVCVYTDTSLVLMFTDPLLCVHFGGLLWLCAWQPSTCVQVCVPRLASVVGV